MQALRTSKLCQSVQRCADRPALPQDQLPCPSCPTLRCPRVILLPYLCCPRINPLAWTVRAFGINELTSPQWAVPAYPGATETLGVYTLEAFGFFTSRAYIWGGWVGWHDGGCDPTHLLAMSAQHAGGSLPAPAAWMPLIVSPSPPLLPPRCCGHAVGHPPCPLPPRRAGPALHQPTKAAALGVRGAAEGGGGAGGAGPPGWPRRRRGATHRDDAPQHCTRWARRRGFFQLQLQPFRQVTWPRLLWPAAVPTAQHTAHPQGSSALPSHCRLGDPRLLSTAFCGRRRGRPRGQACGSCAAIPRRHSPRRW